MFVVPTNAPTKLDDRAPLRGSAQILLLTSVSIVTNQDAGTRWGDGHRQALESGEGTCEQRVAACWALLALLANHAQGWELRATLHSTDLPDT